MYFENKYLFCEREISLGLIIAFVNVLATINEKCIQINRHDKITSNVLGIITLFGTKISLFLAGELISLLLGWFKFL